MPSTSNYSTLAGLLTRVRRRADMVNSTFCSDAEIEQYIQESYFELYDLIIESVGPQHFYNVLSFDTVAGTFGYALTDQLGDEGPFEIPAVPLDVYKVLGVDVSIDGYPRPIRYAPISERGISADDAGGWTDASRVRYFLSTDIDTVNPSRKIWFLPTPQAVHGVHIHYIPMPEALSGDGTGGGDHTLLHYAHWDEYVVVDAAMKCLEKEESDTTHLAIRKNDLRNRIVWQANTMDAGEGGRVRDVDSEARRDPWWGFR